jgi:hypothetical protein
VRIWYTHLAFRKERDDDFAPHIFVERMHMGHQTVTVAVGLTYNNLVTVWFTLLHSFTLGLGLAGILS